MKEGEALKSVLKYPGAKNRLAPWICEYIPKHNVYLEPFGGSLAVLFNKERAIYLTPFSRKEYISAYEYTDDSIEKARRFAVKCWMGFGCGNLYRNGFKSGQQTHSPNPAKAWAELPETLELAAERLSGVQIECLPAVELINRYDTEDVFIYADPPYLHGTRKNYLYRHEMKDSEHEELINLLSRHPGRILLSGYDNDLYNTVLSGWKKVQKDTRAEFGRRRVETLWMNYEVESQISLIL